MTNVYLSSLPREFIRSMAGFRREGSFYCARAEVVPPPEVSQHVFPDIEGWLACFDGVEGCDPVESDLAGQGFLRLLQELRTVFLQDSAILRPMFPSHPVWEHPLFETPAYRAFAAEVLVAHAKTEVPEDLQLRTAMPVVEERLSTLQQVIGGKVDYWGHRNSVKLDIVDGHLQDMLQGRFEWTLTPTRRINPAPPAAAAVQSNSTGLPAAEAASIDLQLQTASIATFPNFPDLVASNAADSAPSPPDFSMSRTLTTVAEAWQEWTAGIAGRPSIQSLDDAWGPAWRKLQKEKMFYCRRKVLINEIRKRAAGGDPCRAVSDLEQIRLQGRRSLDALQKLLNRQQKEAPL